MEKYGYGGANDFGQLGTGDVKNRNIPTLITAGHVKEEKIKDIKCGGQHSTILSASGKIFCFGDGQFGQLGVDLRQFKTMFLQTAVNVPSQEKICRIDCGAAHTAAITETGSLFTWEKEVEVDWDMRIMQIDIYQHWWNH